MNQVGYVSADSEMKEFTYKYRALEECVTDWQAYATGNAGEIVVKWTPIKNSTHLSNYQITVSIKL